MNKLPHRQIAVLLFVLLGAAWTQAQRPPSAAESAATSEEEPKGQIEGTVVSAKTGELLRGVSVILSGMSGARREGTGAPVTLSTVAGMDGRFEFSQLLAGEYALMAGKTGYGGEFSFRPLARIALGSGETRKGIALRLQPSAVVTGRVFDAYGEPLPGAQVIALSRRYIRGRGAQWMTTQRALANDLGQYRLHSLEAGKYILAAQSPRTTNPVGVGFVEFASRYYPESPSLEQATPVKLRYGSELTGIDFRLELSPETTVRGMVVDESTGKPCDTCTLEMMDKNAMGLNIGLRPTKEGIFAFHGLQPGEHKISIRVVSTGSPRFAAASVQVPESGEAEVRVAIGGPVPVTGEVVLDEPPEQEPAPERARPTAAPEDAPPKPQRPFSVNLEPSDVSVPMGGRGMAPAQGGAFEIADVLPGDYHIRVYGTPDAYLRSVVLDGRDLGPQISISRDAPVSGLKLHIAFDGATIRGVVKPDGEQDSSADDPFVVAVPDGSNPYANEVMNRVEPGGSFTLHGVAPGTYTLCVVPGPSIDFSDPELQRVLKPYTKQITVRKKEAAQVEMRAVPESLDLF